jgi:hypothetical protein
VLGNVIIKFSQNVKPPRGKVSNSHFEFSCHGLTRILEILPCSGKKNYKIQNTNYKQITMSEATNPKLQKALSLKNLPVGFDESNPYSYLSLSAETFGEGLQPNRRFPRL